MNKLLVLDQEQWFAIHMALGMIVITEERTPITGGHHYRIWQSNREGAKNLCVWERMTNRETDYNWILGQSEEIQRIQTTKSGHIYLRGDIHNCTDRNCPAQAPIAETDPELS